MSTEILLWGKRHGPAATGSPGYRSARPRDEPITAAPFSAIARYDSRSLADQQHRSYSGEGGRQRGGEKGAPAQARPRALRAAAGPADPANPAVAADRHHRGRLLRRDSSGRRWLRRP